MNIEFFGLPGSGKSYLCRELINYYAQHSAGKVKVEVAPLIEDQPIGLFNMAKYVCALLFLLTRTRYSLLALSIIFRMKPVSRRRQITKTINILSELRRIDSSSTAVPIVIEQGLLQAIWSLEMLNTLPVADSLMRTLSLWLPLTVIVIEIPNRELYLERLSNRKGGQSYFDRLSREQVIAELESGDNVIQQILALLILYQPEANIVRLANDQYHGPMRIAACIDREVNRQSL